MDSCAAHSGRFPAAMRSAVHFASTNFMMGSPHPVVEAAALLLFRYQPQPISDESPSRPGALLSVPPVEVAAAILPSRSSASAPTVSCEIVGANRSLPPPAAWG